jgi:Dyp-type peroxidase family
MDTAPVNALTAKHTTQLQNAEWKPMGETAADLQALAASAYPKQLFAMLVMVQFPKSETARPNAWLAQLIPRVTAFTGPRPICLNVAFSARGLSLLNLPDTVIETFSLPFKQGMTTDDRSRFLGDTPSTWTWSDSATNPNCVHAQLMIYAMDQDSFEATVSRECALLEEFGLVVGGQILQRVKLSPDNQRHEHFGFADGVSQPVLIDGMIPVSQRGLHEIPAGEVVLGQINTYGVPAAGPVVAASDIAAQNLKPATLEGLYDFGLNGTYLVIRQLKQDVAKFWNNMKAASADLLDENNKQATDVWLAEKAVGRTLSGDMLTPRGPVPGNDMIFFANDQAGFGCPITSHVRRANPRDGLAPTQNDTQEMINATNRHRIIRRGRIYGEPISDKYTDDGADRGLLFVCMNSDLERQFEFVQHTWLLNPMFGLGYNESDPLLGPSCPFSIPSKPVRQQPVIETFITPVGGGYFFLPSMRALRYLGALGQAAVSGDLGDQ